VSQRDLDKLNSSTFETVYVPPIIA
jgi:hypothetical protein